MTGEVSESVKSLKISIHTLCVEGDVEQVAVKADPLGISIHTLCVEGDRWRQLEGRT